MSEIEDILDQIESNPHLHEQARRLVAGSSTPEEQIAESDEDWRQSVAADMRTTYDNVIQSGASHEAAMAAGIDLVLSKHAERRDR